MAIEDNASIALIPSGYKSGKLYSVIPDDGDGDFTHSRGSTATRVAASGLIETVASGVPRLDYPLIDGVVQDCPALLLEPQRTNDLQRTEQFDNSYWTKNQASITADNTVSPNGLQTADKLVEDSSTNFHRVVASPTTAAATYTFSVFAKADEREFLVLRNNLTGANKNACFNLTSGSISYNGFSGDAEIENYGNGWFRCSITETDPSGGATSFSILLSNSAVTNDAIPSYTGDGSSGLHIWGAQLEQGSYKTSYIPWDGSGTTTRSADVCNGSGTSAEFNDSEGVLFAEIAALADVSGLSSRRITITDNSGANYNNIVSLELDESINTLKGFVSDNSGSITSVSTTNLNQEENNKIALKYNSASTNLYVNGFEVNSASSTNLPTGLIKLDFDSGRSDEIQDFYGKTKQLMTFKTALTDSELETLTSWDSFTAMAKGQLYTIE